MSPDTTDELVPDAQVRRELGGLSEMTTWRWDHDAKWAPKMAELNWPPPIKINRRNYRSRQGLNKFRETCMHRTITERAGQRAA